MRAHYYYWHDMSRNMYIKIYEFPFLVIYSARDSQTQSLDLYLLRVPAPDAANAEEVLQSVS